MTLKNLTIEKDGQIAVITINRPDALNAINMETMTEIGDAMLELGGDADVRVVIVTGAGKAFVAGADISSRARIYRSSRPRAAWRRGASRSTASGRSRS